MPPSGALVFCSCGHTTAEHAQGGKCRAKSASDWPCECPAVDVDDEDQLYLRPMSAEHQNEFARRSNGRFLPSTETGGE